MIFWVVALFICLTIVAVIIWNTIQRQNEELLDKRYQDGVFINQIIRTFAKCIDMRDSQNKGHSFRVAEYTRMLADKLRNSRGYTDEDVNNFYNIALLHDIGKLSIPDKILNKPCGLTDEEYEIMKSHAKKGEEILKDVDIVRDLAVGAGYHHERMDGNGYPNGLKGDEIPEVARLIAVADTFDAMYSTRPYRKRMELEDVLSKMSELKGTQLEDEVVDALLELAEEKRIY